MLLTRCQHNEVSDIWDFNQCNGQNGKGVYFFKKGCSNMIKYYSKNGEKIYHAEISDSLVMDLSKLKLDYWELQAIIFNNPNKKAFIFTHKGYNIPTSKEILVTDVSVLKLL